MDVIRAKLESSSWTDTNALRRLMEYYKDLAFPARVAGVLYPGRAGRDQMSKRSRQHRRVCRRRARRHRLLSSMSPASFSSPRCGSPRSPAPGYPMSSSRSVTILWFYLREPAVNPMNILFSIHAAREFVKIFGMFFRHDDFISSSTFEKVPPLPLVIDAHALDVLAYFVLKMPAISYQIAPLAVLMATLLTIGLPSRSHEITAMRSCGISLYWITSPFIFSRNGPGDGVVPVHSTVSPPGFRRKADQIKTTQIEKRVTPVSLNRGVFRGVSLGTPADHRHDDPGRRKVLRNIRLYRLSPTFH